MFACADTCISSFCMYRIPWNILEYLMINVFSCAKLCQRSSFKQSADPSPGRKDFALRSPRFSSFFFLPAVSMVVLGGITSAKVHPSCSVRSQHLTSSRFLWRKPAIYPRLLRTLAWILPTSERISPALSRGIKTDSHHRCMPRVVSHNHALI
jgi:hypothetical protein